MVRDVSSMRAHGLTWTMVNDRLRRVFGDSMAMEMSFMYGNPYIGFPGERQGGPRVSHRLTGSLIMLGVVLLTGGHITWAEIDYDCANPDGGWLWQSTPCAPGQARPGVPQGPRRERQQVPTAQ